VATQQQPGVNILLELRAREAFMKRRFDQALELSRQAAELASGRGDAAASWQMAFLQAECLREQGPVQECISIAEELWKDPLTRSSPALAARVLTMLSVTSQIVGTLPRAIEMAREAVRLSSLDDQSIGLRIEAELALIASLTESGQPDEAWAECLMLDTVLDQEPDSQVAGKAYWAIGNVAFLRRQADDGVKFHRLAAEHLSPSNDLALWAWFNRSSAAMRLAAGVLNEETNECIQRAELATSIVGGNDGDRLVVEFTKGHWHFLQGEFREASSLLSAVSQQGVELPGNLLGETWLLLGQSLSHIGEGEAALGYLRRSEEYFLQAGVADRAAQAAALISEIEASP
jgi:tetratricopeptide (TPR) repeat protein